MRSRNRKARGVRTSLPGGRALPAPRPRCPKARRAAAVKQHKDAANHRPVPRSATPTQELLDRRRTAALPRDRSHLNPRKVQERHILGGLKAPEERQQRACWGSGRAWRFGGPMRSITHGLSSVPAATYVFVESSDWSSSPSAIVAVATSRKYVALTTQRSESPPSPSGAFSTQAARCPSRSGTIRNIVLTAP